MCFVLFLGVQRFFEESKQYPLAKLLGSPRAQGWQTGRPAAKPDFPHPFREGTGSVRFVSVPDFSKFHRFGSVRSDK